MTQVFNVAEEDTSFAGNEQLEPLLPTATASTVHTYIDKTRNPFLLLVFAALIFVFMRTVLSRLSSRGGVCADYNTDMISTPASALPPRVPDLMKDKRVVFATIAVGRVAHSYPQDEICTSAHSVMHKHPGVPFYVFHDGEHLSSQALQDLWSCGLITAQIHPELRRLILEAASISLGLQGLTASPENSNAIHRFLLISLWTYTQFDRMIYIDSNSVALRPLDEMFNCETDNLCGSTLLEHKPIWAILALTRVLYRWFNLAMPNALVRHISPGLLSIKPDREVFKLLISALRSHKHSLQDVEMGFLSSMFVTSRAPGLQQQFEALPVSYNVFGSKKVSGLSVWCRVHLYHFEHSGEEEEDQEGSSNGKSSSVASNHLHLPLQLARRIHRGLGSICSKKSHSMAGCTSHSICAWRRASWLKCVRSDNNRNTHKSPTALVKVEKVNTGDSKRCAPLGPSYDLDGRGVFGQPWPLKLGPSSRAEDCAARCEALPQCEGFFYYGDGSEAKGDCYLKEGVMRVWGPMKDGPQRYASACKPTLS